jgi:hypothetical protein
MGLQFSTAVRNASLNQLEASVGASPKLRFYSGAPPANCAAAVTGTLIVEFALPADWQADAANGSKAMAGGPWTANAAAAGTIGYFRLYDSATATCHMQGTAGAAGSDFPIDNPTTVVGQELKISGFTITAGNA